MSQAKDGVPDFVPAYVGSDFVVELVLIEAFSVAAHDPDLDDVHEAGDDRSHEQ